MPRKPAAQAGTQRGGAGNATMQNAGGWTPRTQQQVNRYTNQIEQAVTGLRGVIGASTGGTGADTRTSTRGQQRGRQQTGNQQT